MILRLSDSKTNEYAHLVGGQLFLEPVEAIDARVARGQPATTTPTTKKASCWKCMLFAVCACARTSASPTCW